MKMAELYVKYNTIDLDSTDKENLSRIIHKILGCEYLIKLLYEPSKRKGYHLKLFCSINCDMCRFIYDDEIRYAFDQFRPESSRNVLNQESEFIIIKLGDVEE